MADPIVPNFSVGAGRLATDRFTYESHIKGLGDRHLAGQIDLFPTVVIGTEQLTVQDAITTISTVIGTPPPDASTSVKGIVRLAGDIAGTATSVSVTKIQGKPISTSTPTSGDVLTWDGSVWKPQSITGAFANLTVTGNTTLGTNSGNSLIVNAVASFTSNLSVNGNTTLGNLTDLTTINGGLTTSGVGDISITGATTTTLNSNGVLSMAASTFVTLVGGTNISLLAGSTMNLTAATLNLKGTSVVVPSTVSTFVIQPSLYTSLQGNVQQASGTFSLASGSQFYIFSGVTATINSNLIMSGSSKINKRYVTGSPFSTYVHPALYDVYVTQGATAAFEWVIDETTYPATQVGIEFEVINNGAQNLTIKKPFFPNAVITTIAPSYNATFYRGSGSGNWLLKYKSYNYT